MNQRILLNKYNFLCWVKITFPVKKKQGPNFQKLKSKKIKAFAREEKHFPREEKTRSKFSET